MRVFIFLLMLASIAHAQSPVFSQCENDSSFFRIVSSRPLPAISCDTVFLITKVHRHKLEVQKSQYFQINSALNKELVLYKEQVSNYQAANKRQQQYIDSVSVFMAEKDKQISAMTDLAKKSTENTDKAIKQAKKYKRLSLGGGVLSALLLVLLAIK